MRRATVALAAVTLGFATAGCPYFRGEEQVTPYRPPAYYQLPDIAPDVEEAGRELYLRDCSFCHGPLGRGTQYAPPLNEGNNGAALTHFMLTTGRMPLDHPEAAVRPNEALYTEDEINALVDYVVRAFNPPGPDIPEVDPAAGDLGAGQQAYEQYCASCHATTAIGGAMLTTREGGTAETLPEGVVIPGLRDSDAVEIAEAVRTGPGPMPVFTPEVLTDEELNSLVRYTLYLQEPRHPGGHPIAYVGPVVEGAVGWALGLGLLVVFIRWIGTKAGERP